MLTMTYFEVQAPTYVVGYIQLKLERLSLQPSGTILLSRTSTTVSNSMYPAVSLGVLPDTMTLQETSRTS